MIDDEYIFLTPPLNLQGEIMAEKNTIIFYTDWADDFEYLEPNEAKELILAIFDYKLGKTPKFSSRVVEGVFRHISKQIDKDTEKWEEVCKTRAENGKKGGRPKKAKKPNGFEENQNKPNGFEKTEQKLMQPKKADNEYEYDNEYDNDFLKEFDNPTLDKTFKEFLEYRQVKTDVEKEKIKSKLVKMANCDEQKMIDILNQSMENGWKALVDINQKKQGMTEAEQWLNV